MATLKAHHAAALGGGTGIGVAGLLVGLLQQALGHTLAPVDVQAIYAVVAVAGAYLGAYLPTADYNAIAKAWRNKYAGDLPVPVVPAPPQAAPVEVAPPPAEPPAAVPPAA